MLNYPSISRGAICTALVGLLLVACQPVKTQSVSKQALSLLSVVEIENKCAIPLDQVREVFTSAGFTSAQQRIDLIWELRTQTGALSVFNRRLEANTETCGKAPAYLSANLARFKVAQGYFLSQNCTTTAVQIKRSLSGKMDFYEFGAYLQIFMAAGALEAENQTLVRKDWGGCPAR